MSPGKYPVKWTLIVIVGLIVGALFFWETNNLKIETDILASMPHSDPVLDSARQVIVHLPVQDKIFIDLEQVSSDREQLVSAARRVTNRLAASGLFSKVGVGEDADLFPELIDHVQNRLPILLSADDLEKKISPLLQPEKIRETIFQNRQSLEQLEGIGQIGRAHV